MFDAPRELVGKAWTDPEHLMRWWGPKDFTAPACRTDLRVGGRTKMTLTHIGLPAGDSDMAGVGWDESFDKLAEILR